MAQGFDAAAQGLQSGDPTQMAAGLKQLSEAAAKTAGSQGSKIQALGEADQQLREALERLRRQKGQGQGQGSGSGNGTEKGTDPGSGKGDPAAAGQDPGAGAGPGPQPGDGVRDPADPARPSRGTPMVAAPRKPGGPASPSRTGRRRRGGPRNPLDPSGATREGGQGGAPTEGDPVAIGTLPPDGPDDDPQAQYKRQVSEYLARENVPLEYQEMIRQYFDRGQAGN